LGTGLVLSNTNFFFFLNQITTQFSPNSRKHKIGQNWKNLIFVANSEIYDKIGQNWKNISFLLQIQKYMTKFWKLLLQIQANLTQNWKKKIPNFERIGGGKLLQI
jgi:hypothetical protein